jgi:hypothetical protein
MTTTNEDRPNPLSPVPPSPRRLIQAFIASALGYAALVHTPFTESHLTIAFPIIVASTGIVALSGGLLLLLTSTFKGQLSSRFTSSIATTVCALGSIAMAFVPNLTTFTLAQAVVLVGAGAVLANSGTGTQFAHLAGLVLGAPTIHLFADAHGRAAVFAVTAAVCALAGMRSTNDQPGGRPYATRTAGQFAGYALLGAAHGAVLPHLLTQHHNNAPAIATLLLTTYVAGAAIGGYIAARLHDTLPTTAVTAALASIIVLALLMPGENLSDIACLAAGLGLATQFVLAAHMPYGLSWAALYLGTAAGALARVGAASLDLPVFGPAAVLVGVSWLLITAPSRRFSPSTNRSVELTPTPQWPLR